MQRIESIERPPSQLALYHANVLPIRIISFPPRLYLGVIAALP